MYNELPVPKTKFQKWLYDNMIYENMTMGDIADLLHCSRQTISYQYKIGKCPSYVNILGYCKIFGYDNPDEIYANLSKS